MALICFKQGKYLRKLDSISQDQKLVKYQNVLICDIITIKPQGIHKLSVPVNESVIFFSTSSYT